MKYKWFWMTLGLWFLLAGSVTTWALIYSPYRLEFSPKARFEAVMNGSRQTHEIEVASGSLENVLAQTMARWRKEGWESESGTLNLASPLLGMKRDEPLLSSFLHVSLFKKGDLRRVLGLWSDSKNGQVYRWVAELPKATLDDGAARSHWKFPVNPPTGVLRLYNGSLEGLQTAGWSYPANSTDVLDFGSFVAAQGFDQSPFPGSPGEKAYILKKGSVRILAVLREGEKGNSVGMVYFPDQH